MRSRYGAVEASSSARVTARATKSSARAKFSSTRGETGVVFRMNCNDFEVIAGDLSKDVLMDANLREKGLEHSSSCADCAARLEDERVLTVNLRLLARASTEAAPANVEAAVLTAFQQKQISPSTRTSYRRWIYVAASAAALVLIVTLLALNASRTQEQQLLSPQATID